ncbi:MAG TPA: helix-turn-helix transcriptional regulator [Rhizomicrobium sp.]|jgi:transcriptional regulator with XRE-family HTH domain
MNISRLRKFRKSADLTQQEVAMLVGYASQRAYSDLELGIKRPALGTALACCILFDASLHELFPALAELVERDVLARARKLEQILQAAANREAAGTHVAAVIKRLDA